MKEEEEKGKGKGKVKDEVRIEGDEIGFILDGAATASSLGLYFLYKDYMVAHESITQQAYRFSSFAKVIGGMAEIGYLFDIVFIHVVDAAADFFFPYAFAS